MPSVHDALAQYLLALADDEFILGHRMSEWTGLGPIIEEDIAFSSMAQDEMGHALGFYTLLHERGADDPDALAFRRGPAGFRNSVFTELPRGDYAFSLVRQLLYDAMELERMEALKGSSDEAIRDLAAKILQEERYHWIHGTSMIKRLAGGTEESRIRVQAALDEAFPYALGLFEPVEGEAALVEAGIAPSEQDVRNRWLGRICPLLEGFGLRVPAHRDANGWIADAVPVSGGRAGVHTEHLAAILEAMQLLSKADPEAQW